MVHTHNEILFSHKNEQSIMGPLSRALYQGEKVIIKVYMLYDSIYMLVWKRQKYKNKSEVARDYGWGRICSISCLWWGLYEFKHVLRTHRNTHTCRHNKIELYVNKKLMQMKKLLFPNVPNHKEDNSFYASNGYSNTLIVLIAKKW